MHDDARKLLWDARQAAERVARFTAGKTIAEYRADELLRSAVERQLGIVGEALSQLSRVGPIVAAAIPDLPRINERIVHLWPRWNCYVTDPRAWSKRNERKIEITIGSTNDALDRFEAAWARAKKGSARGAEVRLTFESLPLLLRSLTPARWQLLETLKTEGPLSINELAKRLARNYKNVHTDVTRLVELGLIQRQKDQRVAVAWDVVTAEMRLAA